MHNSVFSSKAEAGVNQLNWATVTGAGYHWPMMYVAKRAARKILLEASAIPAVIRTFPIYRRYRTFTMISSIPYVNNLLLCARKAPRTGCVVEAGVWRGGMSAGIADMLPGRDHYLFDSFEGLPPAKEVDGTAALEWQRDTQGPRYFDNCRAEIDFAERAMKMSHAKQFRLIRGWFSDTVAKFKAPAPIGILRIDGDWYDSTIDCLTSLYPQVMPGGLIIIDDYYTWDGCTRAVHDYLSTNKIADRIEKWRDLAYLIKRECPSSPARLS